LIGKAVHTLKPSTSSKSGRGCLLLFALFWLGFSLVWTYMAWRGGGAMALFGVPFILIGLFLILGALWRNIASVKVVPPTVSVSNASPSLGETIRVKWKLRFRTKTVLQDGRVELLFRESASYTQGTDRRTDTQENVEEFYELPVGEMEAGKTIEGQTDFIIPGEGMHSFKAENNRLDWLLRVRLNAMEWPDLEDEYELNVQPQEAWGR
jgi:hypothetical protein